MASLLKGYITYTPSVNTKVFIYNMFQSSNCSVIYEQSSPHDLDTLQSCINGLSPGNTLVLWRLDKSIPKYHNKINWLTSILSREVSIICLADRITIEHTPEHPLSRLCFFLKSRK